LRHLPSERRSGTQPPSFYDPCAHDHKVLVAQFEAGQPSGYLSIAISLLVLITGMWFQVLGRSRLFRHAVRIFLTDYGTILTIVFFSAFPHFGGELRTTQLLNLPTSPTFETTTGRGWLVDFWNIGVGNVFLAIPFAILLTILFYMDHNISVRRFRYSLIIVFDLSRHRVSS
jgi:boron transporter